MLLDGCSGRPLPNRVRVRMERLFGASLATVRWREDGEAERLGALAFACGEDIHFARGAFNPATPRGLFVLGHEIAHVLQQRGCEGPTEAAVLLDDAGFEAEADRAGLHTALGLQVRIGVGSAGARTVQRIKLQINSTQGVIDAAVLAASVDLAIEAAVGAVNAAPVVTAGPPNGYHIVDPQYWIALAGRLSETGIIVPGYGGGNRTSVLPCRIKVGRDSGGRTTKWMPVVGIGGTERLDFTPQAVAYAGGRNDLSYPEIAAGFRTLAASHPDHAVARDMLLLMMGKAALRTYTEAEFDFITGVVALMFGLEASRFPSALVSSLLLLDLIMYRKGYGRDGVKVFTLEAAFDSGEKFDFKLKYGGKYPCAVHKPGAGNSRNRRMLGQMGLQPGDNPGRVKHVNHLLNLNHRYIVPQRETTLLIHWIEASCTDGVLQNITVAQINELLRRRLSAAYFTADLPGSFPASPRANTGSHSYNSDRSDLPSEADLMQPGGQVIWFARGRFFHYDWYCKLIGDRAPHLAPLLKESFTKSFDAKKALDQRDDITKWWAGTVGNAKAAGKLCCPNCIRP